MTQRYLRWMALNSWASSTAMVLSTNSMLTSVLTTPSYTTVLATTYVGKDIVGQVGGMIYAWKTGQKADREPKKYITKGSILEQVGIQVENGAAALSNQDWGLPVLGLASLFKNISFISVGAVNAHNLKILSENSQNGQNSEQKEKIGQLYSRVASVNTLASTAGMLSGIALLHVVPSYTVRSICVLPALSLISLFSVRRATEVANNIKQNEKDR